MASELKNLSNYEDCGILHNSPEKKYKIGIAISEWNKEITESMADAAIETLKKYSFTTNDILVRHVPGSFELPLAAKYFIDYAKVDAVICLGCVIQGDTRHFDFVCSGVTQGIMELNISTGIPVAFGLLTTNNQQQALDRSGGRLGNKGNEAAIAVLKMLYLKHNLQCK
ncbi:6,7-dimethyl-8-ribityllumazine synthase [Bacteroidales bacterium OttesenSCG-928-I21]|nr:6,7-dimethyl-8-ribityllumazine synthase [Bacteroidales bacterium OttesenSCG-928-I21]